MVYDIASTEESASIRSSPLLATRHGHQFPLPQFPELVESLLVFLHLFCSSTEEEVCQCFFGIFQVGPLQRYHFQPFFRKFDALKQKVVFCAPT